MVWRRRQQKNFNTLAVFIGFTQKPSITYFLLTWSLEGCVLTKYSKVA